MKKIKKWIAKFKELWADKKKRAWLTLAIYCIFLIFAVNFIRVVSMQPTLPKEQKPSVQEQLLDRFGKGNDYQFTYQMTSLQEDTIIAEGQVTPFETRIIINDVHFYQKDNQWYQKQELEDILLEQNPLPYYLEPPKLVNILKQGVLQSKSEDFETKAITYVYRVANTVLPFSDVLTVEGNSFIEVVEIDNNVSSIIIHLDQMNDKQNKIQITIFYSKNSTTE